MPIKKGRIQYPYGSVGRPYAIGYINSKNIKNNQKPKSLSFFRLCCISLYNNTLQNQALKTTRS